MLDEEKVVMMRTNSKSKNNFTDLNLTYTLYLIDTTNKNKTNRSQFWDQFLIKSSKLLFTVPAMKVHFERPHFMINLPLGDLIATILVRRHNYKALSQRERDYVYVHSVFLSTSGFLVRTQRRAEAIWQTPGRGSKVTVTNTYHIRISACQTCYLSRDLPGHQELYIYYHGFPTPRPGRCRC